MMKTNQTSVPKTPLAATRVAMTLSATLLVAEAQRNQNFSEERRTPGIPRMMQREHPKPMPESPPEQEETIEPPDEHRTIDGSDNNLTNPTWGEAAHPVLRLFPNAYADNTSSPAGADRPSARAVSNAVVAQEESIPNRRGASDFLWQWGQFVDHDIIETPTIDPAEPFDISVQSDDLNFPAGSTIPLNRSLYETTDGVREQLNEITAYLDGSMIYGSDEERAFALRRLDGSGKLKTSDSDHGDLLPYNDAALPNAPSESPAFFLAGDVRANEQLGLTAMHTLFVREHNHWAEQYAEKNPQAMDEEIYQFARSIVAAEIQAITYREFLPVLLGRHALRPYQGYRPKVRADISNEFGAAAYRIGHSLLSPTLQRVDARGNEAEEGHLPLAEAFFDPSHIQDHGIESILRGLAAQQCQELDEKLVDGVRNLLFGAPGSGGFDLAALNIQRGRDHGLPDYNSVRKAMGLRPLRRFRDLTRDRETQEALESVYDNVDQLDLWLAGLCARDVKHSMVGPVFQRILVDQFTRLRDGDRFYYESALPKKLVALVHQQTLAKIIRRNTEIGQELPKNVFLVEKPKRLKKDNERKERRRPGKRSRR